MICQGKLNSKTLKHNDINCWKSSHACHPKQARHLPFNSDWVRFVVYSIFLRRCFQQLFGAAHAALKLQPSTLKGNGKTSSTSLSLSWRASHMAIQVAVGLDQWRASNTWRMGTFAAMLWAGFIWVGVPGIGLIMYGYFWNYHPPITILTRPIWYVWFLCLVMSGYNKIK